MPIKNNPTRKKDVMSGTQFRELRESIGLSQTELAEEMGVYVPWVSRIESEYEGRKPTVMAVNFIKYIQKHIKLEKSYEKLKKKHADLKMAHDKLQLESKNLCEKLNEKS